MSETICSSCFSTNKASAKFCRKCGSKISSITTQPTGLTCPNCNAGVPENAKFCRKCGSKVTQSPKKSSKTCSNCSAPAPSTAKFCRKCGTPFIEQVAERKQPQHTCPKCNASIPPNAKFCKKCGHNLQAPGIKRTNKQAVSQQRRSRPQPQRNQPKKAITKSLLAEMQEFASESHVDLDQMAFTRHRTKLLTDLENLSIDLDRIITKLERPARYNYRDLVSATALREEIKHKRREGQKYNIPQDVVNELDDLEQRYFDVEMNVLEYYTEMVTAPEVLELRREYYELAKVHTRERAEFVRFELMNTNINKMEDLLEEIIEHSLNIPDLSHSINFAKGWDYELRKMLEQFDQASAKLSQELDDSKEPEFQETEFQSHLTSLRYAFTKDGNTMESLLNLLEGLPRPLNDFRRIVTSKEEKELNDIKQISSRYVNLLKTYKQSMHDIINEIGYQKIRDFQPVVEDASLPVTGALSFENKYLSEDVDEVFDHLQRLELEDKTKGDHDDLQPIAPLQDLKDLSLDTTIQELTEIEELQPLGDFNVDLHDQNITTIMKNAFPLTDIENDAGEYVISFKYGGIKEYRIKQEADQFKVKAIKPGYYNDFEKVSLESSEEYDYSMMNPFEFIDVETSPTYLVDKLSTRHSIGVKLLKIAGYKNLFLTKHDNELHMKLIIQFLHEENLMAAIDLMKEIDTVINSI